MAWSCGTVRFLVSRPASRPEKSILAPNDPFWKKALGASGYLKLVGGWAYPSEKYESQWEGWHPIYWKNIKCSKAPTSHKWRFLNWGYHKIIQNQTIHFVLKPMVTLGSPISKPPKFWKQSCTWPPANHEYSVFCILNIHVWFFSANHWHALTTVPLINPFVSHS